MIQIILCKKKKQSLINLYKKCEHAGDIRGLVKSHALLLYFDGFQSIAEIAKILLKSSETVRQWIHAYILNGINSIKIKWARGRKSKLSQDDRKALKEMLMNSPEKYGFLAGGWNSAMIAELIYNMFNVEYSVKYIPELMKKLRFSYQKARFDLGGKSFADRLTWLNEKWPKILRKAKKTKAKIFFEDESSFALWGSLSYCWSPIGYQPKLKTKGNRKSYKIFGLIEYFTGKLIYQGIDSRINSTSYIDFLKFAQKKIKGNAIIIHDGARYHKSALTKEYYQSVKNRIDFIQLPSYSPDYNPIEHLWRKVKRSHTHLVYFKSFEDLIFKVELALQEISKKKDEILSLFGFYTKP